MTSDSGKCGAGYFDDKLPRDAHYGVNSGINCLKLHNLHKKGCIPIFIIFIVQNALEIAHLPSFLQISQA